jgi:hypothetical protein
VCLYRQPGTCLCKRYYKQAARLVNDHYWRQYAIHLNSCRMRLGGVYIANCESIRKRTVGMYTLLAINTDYMEY